MFSRASIGGGAASYFHHDVLCLRLLPGTKGPKQASAARAAPAPPQAGAAAQGHRSRVVRLRQHQASTRAPPRGQVQQVHQEQAGVGHRRGRLVGGRRWNCPFHFNSSPSRSIHSFTFRWGTLTEVHIRYAWATRSQKTDGRGERLEKWSEWRHARLRRLHVRACVRACAVRMEGPQPPTRFRVFVLFIHYI